MPLRVSLDTSSSRPSTPSLLPAGEELGGPWVGSTEPSNMKAGWRWSCQSAEREIFHNGHLKGRGAGRPPDHLTASLHFHVPYPIISGVDI